MNKLQMLRERLGEVREELRTLAEIDAAELTDEQDARFAELETELAGDGENRGLLDNIDREEQRAQIVARVEETAGRSVTEHGDDRGVPNVNRRSGDDPFDLDTLRVSPFDNPQKVSAEIRGRALTAIEKIATDQDEHKQRMTELVERHDGRGDLARRILTTGSEQYERAFASYLAGRPLVGDEARALSVGTDAEGGYAVPVALDPTVILTSDGSVNPLRQIARVETITTKEWQGVTSDGITVTRKGEGTQATDDSPGFDQPTVTPTRVDAFVPFSYEIDQDWTQLRSELSRMIGEAKDDEEAASFVTGNGVGNNPGGVVGTLAAGSKIDTADVGTFAAGDVYALDNALPERFRARAQFLANKVVYNDVRQFASADGHDLWERIGEGRPPLLLGYPAREASAMDDDSTAQGGEILLLGDFRNFLIVDRVGMSVELIPHLFGADRRPTGQRGIFAFWRNSSTILADNAFRLLVVDSA